MFDQAVAAIKQAKAAGFRVMTNTTFFNTDTPQDVIDVLDYLNDDLGVDNMQISPGYAYEKAPDQEHWLGVEQTRELFTKAFADGRRKKWRLNHSPMFLDFLEGKVDFDCTAWGIPSYSLLGWQRPCYLMDDGYASTYKELHRDHRLGRLRPRQGPALRQLHGALRLRADRGARHHGLAEGVDPGGDLAVSAGEPAGRLAGIRCPADLRAVPAGRAAPTLAAEIRGAAARHRAAAPAGTSGPTSAWSS